MVNYIGGKTKIAKWLLQHYPKDMERYTEVFGGMMGCFFNMNIEDYPNLKEIIYNDYNGLNSNLFKCVKNPVEFLKVLDDMEVQKFGELVTPTIYKEKFYQYQQEIFNTKYDFNEPNYDVAAKYIYVITQVFSGINPEKSTFIDLKGKYKSKFYTFKNKLKNDKFINQVSKITTVENMDYQDFINKYDSETTFHYVDPPYYSKEKYYSSHNFGLESHQQLAQQIKNIKGKFGISYYDFDDLNIWFPKTDYNWESKEFIKIASAKKGSKQTFANELFIMNY